jgi:hypothetical protein
LHVEEIFVGLLKSSKKFITAKNTGAVLGASFALSFAALCGMTSQVEVA